MQNEVGHIFGPVEATMLGRNFMLEDYAEEIRSATEEANRRDETEDWHGV